MPAQDLEKDWISFTDHLKKDVRRHLLPFWVSVRGSRMLLPGLFLILGLGVEIEDKAGRKFGPDCVVGVVGKDLELTIRIDKAIPNKKFTIVEGETKGPEIKIDKDGKGEATYVVKTTKRVGNKSLTIQEGPFKAPVPPKDDTNKENIVTVPNSEKGPIDQVVEIYFVFGTPREKATAAKMKMAMKLVNEAYEDRDEPFSVTELVHQISINVNRYYNPLIHYDPDKAWDVPETWGRGGASCISNSYFLKSVNDVLGMPGKFDTVAIYATPDNPTRARFDGVNVAKAVKESRRGELEYYLVDERNTRGGRIGGYGGMNHYEGCLVHDYQGSRTYYPGGTAMALKDPNAVLSIFRALVWARYDTKRDEWVVVEVIKSYKGAVMMRRGLFGIR